MSEAHQWQYLASPAISPRFRSATPFPGADEDTNLMYDDVANDAASLPDIEDPSPSPPIQQDTDATTISDDADEKRQELSAAGVPIA